ncbi:enolase C-terminal domain-like protein [Lentinula aff. detonsa]|uniref:Enolase C-terminal domain-like protein n=1 Tax=Lentinula aff. detonsa TaxID=2804958 RepID=A0AA38KMQ6_9AGAR|nr:enolase C-terminal domain-like protein [Lentinula aff. detonsa]
MDITPSTITDIEIFRLPPRWLFVQVKTSDNIFGWGESTLEGHTEAIEGAFSDLRERFIGAIADNIQDTWPIAYMGRFYCGGPVLMGKKLGVPIWQLLGGKIRGNHPSAVVSAAEARKAQGFTAVKMNGTDLPDSMLELIFMGRLHRGMAKQLAKLLEPLRPMFIEGPYLERRAIDIAQPDVSHCGEISELHRIASYAETHDVALAPHCPLGPIALAVCMQMHYNVAAGVALGIEADLHSYMANPEVFTVKDGYVAVRQGPGIGVEIDEGRVRKASELCMKHTPRRNPLWRGEDGSLKE